MKLLNWCLLWLIIGGVSCFCVQTCKGQSFTCAPTPCIPFQNTDLLQIYGGIKSIGCNTCLVTSSISSGNVGGFTSLTSYTIPLDGTYTAGVNVGGIITASNVIRVNSGTGILQSINVVDTSGFTPDINIDFWSASPTGTFTNLLIQNMPKFSYYLGTVSVSSGDYITNIRTSRATIPGIGIVLRSDGDVAAGFSKWIWFTVVVNSGSYNYGNKAIRITLGILQD